MRGQAFSFIKWSQWEFHLAKGHWKERIKVVNFKGKIAFRTSNSREDKSIDILQLVQRLLVHMEKQMFPELSIITVVILWKESERRCMWTHMSKSWPSWCSLHFNFQLYFFYHRFFYLFYYYYYWPCCTAFWTLVPQSGIEPGPLAANALSPNYWTAREVPRENF